MITVEDVMDNISDPQTLAEMYHKDPQGFEILKKQFPHWKILATMYNPSILKTLTQLGVPV